MGEDELRAKRRMWTALAWVTPVGIPLSMAFMWTIVPLAPPWAGFVLMIGGVTLAPLFWLIVTLASSIKLGRDLADATTQEAEQSSRTVFVTIGVFFLHILLSVSAVIVSCVLLNI